MLCHLVINLNKGLCTKSGVCRQECCSVQHDSGWHDPRRLAGRLRL